MLKKSKTKQKSLAEKVAELISHPNQSGSESESENETSARVVEDFDDGYQLPEGGVTEFRKRNVKLLSEQSSKYKGKIASRKDFEEQEDETEESDDEEEEEVYEESNDDEDDSEQVSEDNDDKDLSSFSKVLKKNVNKLPKKNYEWNDEQEYDDQSSEDEEEQEEDEEEQEDDDDTDIEDEEDNDETEVISKVNYDAEIQKGLCVRNQLNLWERLLELRINFQKIMSKTNHLPNPTELKALRTSKDKYKTIAQETTKQTQNLLESLLALQDTLYSQYSEISQSIKPTLKRSSPFSSNDNEGPPLKQTGDYLHERFESFRSYRNTVLLKWDDRTKLLQPGAGVKKKSLNEEYDIIKKIDNALLNKSVLIQKSQQIKNKNQQQKIDEDTENLENEDVSFTGDIYDDSDFYHQQLRELIEYKANTSNNMSEVTKQFLELQKLRQKMKKKVDTRASKGRKLRYVVHNKLINFMAPHDNSTWTNESKDELCKSLFV